MPSYNDSLSLLFFSPFSFSSPFSLALSSSSSFFFVWDKVNFSFSPSQSVVSTILEEGEMRPYVFGPIRSRAFASGKESGIHSWILPPGVEALLAAFLTDGHGASAGKPSLGNFARTHYHHHHREWGGVRYPTYIATKLFFCVCMCVSLLFGASNGQATPFHFTILLKTSRKDFLRAVPWSTVRLVFSLSVPYAAWLPEATVV